jgi:Tol biopolymer transport system component
MNPDSGTAGGGDDQGNITGLVQVPEDPLLSGAAAHDWSPDGTRLVYTSGPGLTPELYVLNLQTGESRRLAERGDVTHSAGPQH